MKIKIVEHDANYAFVKTCDCCPEQYDVFDSFGRRVGFVHYRYGILTCKVPDVGGHVVFRMDFGDKFDGCFASEEERRKYLELIAEAIEKYMED